MAEHYVYLMGSYSGTLYTGVTNDLMRRVYEHQSKLIDGFTKKYNVSKLLYYKTTTNIESAIARESKSRIGSGKRKLASLSQ